MKPNDIPENFKVIKPWGSEGKKIINLSPVLPRFYGR